MIPRYFRKTAPWQLIFVILVACLFWIPQLGKASLPLCHHERSILCPWIESFAFAFGSGGWTGQITALLLVIMAGLLSVQIWSSHQLIERSSFFPAYAFVLLSSFHASQFTLHPVLPAALLLMLALHFLLRAYDTESALKMVFSASFSIALASLIYFPVLGFGILPWMALLIYRDFGWRNWTGVLLGLLTPYIYTFTLQFLVHDLSYIKESYFAQPIHITLFPQGLAWQHYLFFALADLLLLRAVGSVLWHLNERVISFRKKQLVILWFLLIALMTLPFSAKDFIPHTLLTTIPATFYLTAFHLPAKKRKWTADFAFILFLGSLILAYLS